MGPCFDEADRGFQPVAPEALAVGDADHDGQCLQTRGARDVRVASSVEGEGEDAPACFEGIDEGVAVAAGGGVVASSQRS